MKTRPAAWQAAAKRAFSERKPYPGESRLRFALSRRIDDRFDVEIALASRRGTDADRHVSTS